MTLDMTSGVPQIVLSRIRESLIESIVNSEIEIDEADDDKIR
jgi:hypothetical protein